MTWEEMRSPSRSRQAGSQEANPSFLRLAFYPGPHRTGCCRPTQERATQSPLIRMLAPLRNTLCDTPSNNISSGLSMAQPGWCIKWIIMVTKQLHHEYSKKCCISARDNKEQLLPWEDAGAASLDRSDQDGPWRPDGKNCPVALWLPSSEKLPPSLFIHWSHNYSCFYASSGTHPWEYGGKTQRRGLILIKWRRWTTREKTKKWDGVQCDKFQSQPSSEMG